MLKKIVCLIAGHKKYQPKALSGDDLITLRDSLGVKLMTVNVCERCKKVYAEVISKANK